MIIILRADSVNTVYLQPLVYTMFSTSIYYAKLLKINLVFFCHLRKLYLIGGNIKQYRLWYTLLLITKWLLIHFKISNNGWWKDETLCLLVSFVYISLCSLFHSKLCLRLRKLICRPGGRDPDPCDPPRPERCVWREDGCPRVHRLLLGLRGDQEAAAGCG